MLPVPTTVIRPDMTAVPLKWVSQPRERRGSRCERIAGKVEAPSVFISIRRMRGVSELVSKTPLRFVVLGEGMVDDDSLVVVSWVGVFWVVRTETRGSM